MKKILGIGASGGCVDGRAILYTKKAPVQLRVYACRPEEEMQRLLCARHAYSDHLELLYTRTLWELDQSSADIFKMYRAVLESEEMLEHVQELVFDRKVSAEYAIRHEMQNLCEQFSAMNSDYMRERGTDIENIGETLIARMRGEKVAHWLGELPDYEDMILVVQSLTPEQMMDLDRTRIKGVVAQGSSVHSHCAILACAMGMPLVVCASGALENITEGELITLNGNTGEVLFSLDEEACLR